MTSSNILASLSPSSLIIINTKLFCRWTLNARLFLPFRLHPLFHLIYLWIWTLTFWLKHFAHVGMVSGIAVAEWSLARAPSEFRVCSQRLQVIKHYRLWNIEVCSIASVRTCFVFANKLDCAAAEKPEIVGFKPLSKPDAQNRHVILFDWLDFGNAVQN